MGNYSSKFLIRMSHNLVFLNKSEICVGKVTRQNTKNESEKSAIDFVVADLTIAENVKRMTIDEEGLLKIKGQRDTDHNTIIVEMKISKIDKHKPEKIIRWRIGAPDVCWQKFRDELRKLRSETENFILSAASIDQKYTKWMKKIEIAARKSIGKTTV